MKYAKLSSIDTAASIKMDLIKAERSYRESKAYESQCLASIEARANELGLTTRCNKDARRMGQEMGVDL